ncbi:SDA1-domain-containing protein [Testicularia cyperi]|uniref:Protein SDA1 n=1 Tax=Testicularia cyperi TaxID=1882483 RepID=A0A317XV36_9BASI|nr:SDA1-domain-containing protein [Testicularia cyperi]
MPATTASRETPAKVTPLVTEGGLTHRSRARGLLNADNLPALQNLLKRQPEAYVEEFTAQWNHYQSLRSIFASDLDAPESVATPGVRINKDQANKFVSLISFVTQLAPSYPEITSDLPSHLSDLLLNHHSALSPDIRASCLRSLILLRNRDVISSEELLKTLFPLLTVTTSSATRTSVQATILQDIKNANAKSKNHRLNRVVQGLLFGIVQKGIDAASSGPASLDRRNQSVSGKTEALWAVRLAANLWKKQIWTDAKTVALLALACFHPHPKVQSSAVRFFLGDLHSAEDDGDNSDDDSDEGPDVDALMHARKVNKKTRSGDRKIRAAAAVAKKKRKAKAESALDGSSKDTGNFAALYLLNDPQNFGEKLFDNLSRGDREKRHSIEIKVRLMQLLSRVMGAHKLCVLSFYSYIVKYLAPHQQHITLILVSLAQSVHDQTPPDVVTPVVRKISDAFVHPGVSSEVVAAGINSIREICRRQPWAMEETLLEDLISYRKSKDKGVCAAARGLLTLYREVNPGLLKKKERGKMGSLAVQEGRAAAPFGVDQEEVRGIQGIDLLEKHLEEAKARAENGEGEEGDGDGEGQDDGWEGWEEGSADGDSDEESEDGWINVSSDDEDGVLRLSDSDDDDDDETRKRKRTVKERLLAAREARQKKRAKLARKTERQARRAAGEDVATSDSDSEGSEAGSQAGSDDEDGNADGDDARSTASRGLKAELAAEEEKISQLATSRILTPADFAKLTELRIAAAEAAIAQGGLAGNRAKKQLEELKNLKRTTSSVNANFIDEGDILGPRKKAKATYDDRIASIEKGREDREKYGSKKGKKNKEVQSSSTNREKEKGKNFQMIARSWSVRSKKNASLREKSKKLRKHIDNSKKRMK